MCRARFQSRADRGPRRNGEAALILLVVRSSVNLGTRQAGLELPRATLCRTKTSCGRMSADRDRRIRESLVDVKFSRKDFLELSRHLSSVDYPSSDHYESHRRARGRGRSARRLGPTAGAGRPLEKVLLARLIAVNMPHCILGSRSRPSGAFVSATPTIGGRASYRLQACQAAAPQGITRVLGSRG